MKFEVFFGEEKVGEISEEDDFIQCDKRRFSSLCSLLRSITIKQPTVDDYNKLEFKYKKVHFLYKNIKKLLKGNGRNRILSIKEVLRGMILENNQNEKLEE